MSGRIKLFIAVLALISDPVAGQQEITWTPNSIPMGSHIAFGAAFPAVKGQPYTAQITQQEIRPLADGSTEIHEAHNIHRRDPEGRMVDEQLPSPRVKQGKTVVYTQHSFVLLDPVAMSTTQWNDEDKTAWVNPLPGYLQTLKGFNGQCSPASAVEKDLVEDLGFRTILGVRTHGCRRTVASDGNTIVTETWFSPRLRIVLLQESHDSHGEQSRLEVTDLVLGEPDPSWFQPPLEYQRVGEAHQE